MDRERGLQFAARRRNYEIQIADPERDTNFYFYFNDIRSRKISIKFPIARKKAPSTFLKLIQEHLALIYASY